MNRVRSVTMAIVAACAAASIGWTADDAAPAPGPGGSPTEIQQLKTQLEQQQKQIEQLRTALEAQQKLLEKAAAQTSQAEPDHNIPNLGQVASTVPIIPRGMAPAAQIDPSVTPLAKSVQETSPSPLTIHIGDASITPVGFMDITNTYRSTNAGTSLQTNFGSIPYNNTMQGRLSEDKWSAENSRVGLRVDAKVHGANVLGYFESDFVGGVAANNTQVSSNSMLLRIRQYYVDVRKGFWEVLAGQAWSMLVPNRRGMSPLPADLFYSQVVDVNYMNGLYWGRIPGVRFIGHPSSKVTFGLALENSTQYFGGSGGGGTPVLPNALTNSYPSEVDNGSANDRTLPNVHPDVLGKIAFDPSSRVHFEVGGVESTVKTFNPLTQQYFTKGGGAGTMALHVGITKNFRVLTNNFYGDGAGRYLFGEAPNFIVRADGSPSLVHSASTVSGFEATIKNFAPYVYYGGIYIDRNVALDANGITHVGYGFPGSPNSQNRSIQEVSFGWTHTLWRDGRYGALQWMAQYAYFFRNPWAALPGAPKNAHENAAWFNLRYVLPGTAPTVEY